MILRELDMSRCEDFSASPIGGLEGGRYAIALFRLLSYHHVLYVASLRHDDSRDCDEMNKPLISSNVTLGNHTFYLPIPEFADAGPHTLVAAIPYLVGVSSCGSNLITFARPGKRNH